MCSVGASLAELDAARPRLDRETEMVSGVWRFGVVLRLLTVEVAHFEGESLDLGVAAREKG